MEIYTIKCQDATNIKCKENVDIEIEICNLTNVQLYDIVENNECEFTHKEAENSRLNLNQNEKDSLKENGSFYRDINYD